PQPFAVILRPERESDDILVSGGPGQRANRAKTELWAREGSGLAGRAGARLRLIVWRQRGVALGRRRKRHRGFVLAGFSRAGGCACILGRRCSGGGRGGVARKGSSGWGGG